VITPWCEKYYPEAAQVISLLVGKRTLDKLSQYCQAPAQLKKEIEAMKLVKCTPVSQIEREDTSRESDPVLALPRQQTEGIIQIELPSSMDPHSFIGDIESYLKEMEPEHEGTVVDVWVLNKNLSESRLSNAQEQTLRIRVQISFNLTDFFAITQAASNLKKKYLELVNSAGGIGKVLTVVPGNYNN
jgi:hypothetical protein